MVALVSTEKPDLPCLMNFGVSYVGAPDTVLLVVRPEDEWPGASTCGL